MLWLEQLKAMGITIALAVVATTIIGLFVKAAIGLRIAADVERRGLDINEQAKKATSRRDDVGINDCQARPDSGVAEHSAIPGRLLGPSYLIWTWAAPNRQLRPSGRRD